MLEIERDVSERANCPGGLGNEGRKEGKEYQR